MKTIYICFIFMYVFLNIHGFNYIYRKKKYKEKDRNNAKINLTENTLCSVRCNSEIINCL